MFKNLQMLNKELQAETKSDSEQMPIVASPAQMPQNPLLCEVPNRNLIYWFGMEDFKTKIKSNVYKNVINDKYYIDIFNKDGKQICFNKELSNEDDCYEHHHIVIDDYTFNPDEYK